MNAPRHATMVPASSAWGCALGLAIALLIVPAHAQPQPAGAAPPDRATPQSIVLIDIRELPLGEALRILAEQTGLNFAASADAAKVNVSLHLRDVSPKSVIDTLSRTHNLYYKRDEESGVYRFHTIAEYQRELSSFREEKTEVFTLLYPNSTDVATAIADLYGQRVRLSLGADERDQTDDLQDRFDRFDILNERSQGLGIFSGNSGISGSGGSGGFSSGAGGGFSNSRSSDESFTRRSDVLRQARQARGDNSEGGANNAQPGDVLRNLSAEDIQRLEAAVANQTGADRAVISEFMRRREATIYVTVIKRHNQLIIRTGDEATMKELEKLIRRLDVPTPLVLLEVKIMAVQLDDGFQSAFDFQFRSGDTAGGFTSGDILGPVGDSFRLLGSELVPGALAFQYVGSHFRARMQLLENENRITLLATPLLLTANNEVSRLFVGEEVPLNRSFGGSQTIVGDSTVTTPGTTTIEFRPVGTTLMLTPNINADRTVTLRVLQEVSNISPTPATVLVPTNEGFVEQKIDVVQSRVVSGTIVAKDGLAVALGGLIEEQLVSNEEKVPLLGELPAIGILFRRETKDRSRKELIVMIRPYVLNTPAESDQISRQLLEELSMHPNAPDARGQLGIHAPDEVLRPQNEQQRIRQYFRFHTITPENRE